MSTQITDSIVINLDNHLIKFIAKKQGKTIRELINKDAKTYMSFGIDLISRIDEQLSDENFFLVEFNNNFKWSLSQLINDNKLFLSWSDDDLEYLSDFNKIKSMVMVDFEIGNHKPIEVYFKMVIGIVLHKNYELVNSI